MVWFNKIKKVANKINYNNKKKKNTNTTNNTHHLLSTKPEVLIVTTIILFYLFLPEIWTLLLGTSSELLLNIAQTPLCIELYVMSQYCTEANGLTQSLVLSFNNFQG